jgi:transposase
MAPITRPVTGVFGGVDTHKRTHTAVALDANGTELGTAGFPATGAGYRRLYAFLAGFGPLEKVGIEGTSSYGAGLSDYLCARGVAVREVNVADNAGRRRAGKNDAIDALAAARAVCSGNATARPKGCDGPVAALRALHLARRSAVQAHTDTLRQIKAMITTAPESVRAPLRDLQTRTLLATLQAPARPDPRLEQAADATRLALAVLAERARFLETQTDTLDQQITALLPQINPALLAIKGVGPDTAARLLITAGQHPERIHSEAAFAKLCGAAPLEASSGETTRHRLNHGGDRQANAALWLIVRCRMSYDQRTKTYVEQRTRQGKTKKEIMRCLKRYIAREIYHALQHPNP